MYEPVNGKKKLDSNNGHVSCLGVFDKLKFKSPTQTSSPLHPSHFWNVSPARLALVSLSSADKPRR
jgi:hypothetical protein